MRKQFNLQDWLKDESQKIETRNGRPAHYIGLDRAGWQVFEIFRANGTSEYKTYHDSYLYDGPGESTYDLFIAEGEKLTPFEVAVKSWMGVAEDIVIDDSWVKNCAKELLSLARKQLIKEGYIIEKKDAEHYLPELKESEDERIREGLIEALKTSKTIGELKFVIPEPIRAECIAYLEKQKELFTEGPGHYFYDGDKTHFCSAPAMEVRELDDSNEPVEHWQYVGEVDLEKEKAIEILEDYLKWAVSESEQECSYTWNELASAIRLGISAMKEKKPAERSDCSGCAKHLEGYISGRSDAENKLLEQFGIIITPDGELRMKPRREPSEEPNIELIQRSWYMEGYHDRKFNNEPKWIIKTGEGGPRYEENPKYGHLIEKKSSEWSEEDEGMLNCIIATLCEEEHGGRETNNKMVTWLDNRLKSLRPVSKESLQSWKPSEDEERLINTSISFLKDFADKGYENAVECIDWLKSKLNGKSTDAE